MSHRAARTRASLLALLYLVSLFLALVMPQCPNCQKSFTTQLSAHLRRCQLYQQAISDVSRPIKLSRHGTGATSSRKSPNPSSTASSVKNASSRLQPGSTSASTSSRPTENLPEEVGSDEEMADGEGVTNDSDSILTMGLPPESPTRRQCAPPPRPPRAFNDTLPLWASGSEEPLDPPPDASQPPHGIFRTPPDNFGIYRTYNGSLPSPKPPQSGNQGPPVSTDSNDKAAKSFWPYPNLSSLLFGSWFWGQGTKSRIDRDHLLKDVLLHPRFDLAELHGVNFNAIDDKFAILHDTASSTPSFPDGWTKSKIPISVPVSKGEPVLFEVQSLHYRNIMAVIRDTFEHHPSARTFCYQPYREYQAQPSTVEPLVADQRLFGELYTSDAFNDEHERIQQLPSSDSFPRAIAALMFWSDSTQVTQFGQAKMWPLYMFFGNQSKYERGRPSTHAAQHIAYFPSLPDHIKDFVAAQPTQGSPLRPAVLAHCRRELMHGAWKTILDPEFISAYEHGTIVKCGDGVTRRLYPRIFTYSADYPEKVLLATIRDLGRCPCPRCLVKKDDIPALGTQADILKRSEGRRADTEQRREKVNKARALIKQGRTVGSTAVEDLLAEESLVPTENAFSSALHKLNVDFFTFFVPDILHEFDLGVWKSFFTHLIRILNALGGSLVGDLDERYREVDPFGRETIRRVDANASDMKKLAARDFEDLLLTSMPVFDGLFREAANEIVQDCLFALCYWHGLAKLRLQTESTLRLLEQATANLGQQLRRFVSEVCQNVKTYETAKEKSARKRRQSSKKPSTSSNERKEKTFNLFTYKLHALGDYAHSIRLFGTTESWSTQTGELEHRRVKEFWKRTNKRNATDQVTVIDQRVRFHERVLSKLRLGKQVRSPSTNSDLPRQCPPQEHHSMSVRGKPLDLPSWLRDYADDPATKHFRSQLFRHVLARLTGGHYEGKETAFTEQELNTVAIRHNRLYSHTLLRVNFTTYDFRREQDIINIDTKRDVLLLADEDPEEGVQRHPFWYARVLGIFHAEVKDRRVRNGRWQRMEFLWVRWFGRDMEYEAGWKAKRLDRVGYVPGEEDAFGFIDPEWVVRGVHMIPAYLDGRTEKYLPKSSIASDSKDLGDWEFYHVNRFCDRDMFIRFLGLGPGHVHLFSENPFGIDVQANLEQQLMEDFDVLGRLQAPEGEGDSDGSSSRGSDNSSSEPDDAPPESEEELRW